MSVTSATVIQRVRDILLDTPWATNFTGTIASTSTTSVTVADGTRWDEGDIVEFQDNGEQLYVSTVVGNVLTVVRGWAGTTAATHDGSVTAITILRDPRFSYKRIKDSIELIMQSLWPYVYKKVTTTITPVSGTVWYDLNASAQGLIQVGQLSSTSPYIYYGYGVRGTKRPVSFLQNAPTTLAASGVAVGFPRGFALTTTNVQVDYAAKLTTNNGSGTYDGITYADINDGLQAECIAYGAASRLVMLSDVQRSTNEDVNMGDSSVQPGMRTRVGRDMWQQHQYYRELWKEDLRRTIPIMSSSKPASASSGILSSSYISGPVPY